MLDNKYPQYIHDYSINTTTTNLNPNYNPNFALIKSASVSNIIIPKELSSLAYNHHHDNQHYTDNMILSNTIRESNREYDENKDEMSKFQQLKCNTYHGESFVFDQYQFEPKLNENRNKTLRKPFEIISGKNSGQQKAKNVSFNQKYSKNNSLNRSLFKDHSKINLSQLISNNDNNNNNVTQTYPNELDSNSVESTTKNSLINYGKLYCFSASNLLLNHSSNSNDNGKGNGLGTGNPMGNLGTGTSTGNGLDTSNPMGNVLGTGNGMGNVLSTGIGMGNSTNNRIGNNSGLNSHNLLTIIQNQKIMTVNKVENSENNSNVYEDESRHQNVYMEMENNNNNNNNNSKENVYSLQFINQNLTKLPGKILLNKEILNILDLSLNKIDTFYIELTQFKNLKVLKLDHNKIKTIPNEISYLKTLQVLSISFNLIKSLPEALTELHDNLIEVNLECNLLQTFGKEITGLKNLGILNLYQNRITNFPTSFKDLCNLKEFIFEWFRYTNPCLSVRQKRQDIFNKLMCICQECELNQKTSFDLLEFLEKLSENKVNMVNLNENNQSKLHIAALNEDISVVKYLASNYPSLIDIIDKDNNTALSAAIDHESYSSVKYLLRYGTNLSKGGGKYGFPLHLAVATMNYRIVKEIIKIGENLNRQDVEGQTSLHIGLNGIIDNPHKIQKICSFLIENGANPNLKNKEGWAPIHISSRKNDFKTINWMINYNKECVEVHGREEPFDLNIKGGQYEWTPMHIAAYSDCSDVVGLLGDAGVNVFKRSLNGYTPKRLIIKYCFTLKLVEKYEKKWLKRNIISSRRRINRIQDGIGIALPLNEDHLDENLQNLNKSKEIGHASKHKFDYSYLYIDNNDILTTIPSSSSSITIAIRPRIAKATPSTLYTLIDKKKSVPTINKNIVIAKASNDDSDDIQPDDNDMFYVDLPTTNTKNKSNKVADNDEDYDGMTKVDYCSELNEDIKVEADIKKRNNIMKDRSLLKKPDIIEEHTNNNEINMAYKAFENIELDLEKYIGNALKKNKEINEGDKINLEYIEQQIKKISNILKLDKVIFTEKLIMLNLLKRIHYHNLNFIIKRYYCNYYKISSDFPRIFYDETNSNSRIDYNDDNTTTHNNKSFIMNNKDIMNLYNAIPKNLMFIYIQLDKNTFENIMVKCELCKLFVEFKNLAALNFIRAIIDDKTEHILVKNEAKQTLMALNKIKHTIQSQSQSSSTNHPNQYHHHQLPDHSDHHDHQSIRINHSLKNEKSHEKLQNLSSLYYDRKLSYQINGPQYTRQVLPEEKNLVENPLCITDCMKKKVSIY